MQTRLKGIAPETAAVLWSEGLFRQFDNRRQVAAYAGLAPTALSQKRGSSGSPGRVGFGMDQPSYGRHRFPPPIIQYAIWLYLRFTL